MTSHPADEVESLRHAIKARAAGYWRQVGDRLEQVAFSAIPDMDRLVASRFAEATRFVPLSSTKLGIVKAALSGQPAISRTSEPNTNPHPSGEDDSVTEAASGYWLLAFGATRSVAVPLQRNTSSGFASEVVAVALAENEPDDQAIVARIRQTTQHWGDLT